MVLSRDAGEAKPETTFSTLSVRQSRMTMVLGLRLLLSPARPACLSERDAERFED